MTKLAERLPCLVASLALLSAPVTAQESAPRAEHGSVPSAIAAGSSAVDFIRVEDPTSQPETSSAVSAQSVLLGGLGGFPASAVAPPPAGEDDPDQQARGPVNAWGVERNFPLAIAETFLVNHVAWAFNEYLIQGGISQVNPDSWWNNLKQGFAWDDNQFSTNMFAHPYQGATYFNVARANGFNYWESIPFALLGSLHWECCGETHRMSINDWATTTIGGAGIGEIFYRLTSAILDNESEGSGRAWREAGVVAMNPGRGVTRLVTGRAFEDDTNPTDPLDHRGNRLSNVMSFGFRAVGKGDRFKFANSKSHAFFELDFTFGTPFNMERNEPFDFFTLAVQVNFREKKPLGRLQGRGNLRSWELSRSETSQRIFTIAHYFDYIDNNAYEFGGQSVGFAYLASWIRSERTRIVAIADIHAMIMGAVNTEYAEFAEIPGVRERDREYDFGSGLGSWLNFYVLRDEYRIIDLSYRFNWLRTLNGTNIGGNNTDHLIQQATLKLKWPVTDDWGVGAEGTIFLRKSYFQEESFGDVTQRNPELRIMAVWALGSRGIF